MKVLVDVCVQMLAVTLLCALVGAAASSSVAWPGAVAVSSPRAGSWAQALVPGQAEPAGYSTAQYISAVPALYPPAPAPLAAGGLASYHPILSSPFVPGSSDYYPSHGFPVISEFDPSLIVPGSPAEAGTPSIPSESFGPAFPPSGPSIQTPGDADSTVIESADLKPDRPMETPSPTKPPQGSPAPPQSSEQSGAPFPSSEFPSLSGSPTNTLPLFPDFLPSFPGFPSWPDIVQNIPQFPSNLFPQGPSQAPPSSFPSATSGDKGLNDADTVSVDSA